jgi:hypothetical protein
MRSESQFSLQPLLPIRREAKMLGRRTGRGLVDPGVIAVSGGPRGPGRQILKRLR